MIRLLRPSARFKKSYLKALQESEDIDKRKTFKRFQLHKEDFSEYVRKIRAYRKGAQLVAGYVPETTFWLINGVEYIGRLSIHHILNENLKKEGGHIGYEIRPSKRGLGYGRLILRLGLKKAKIMRFKKVLITCNENNILSIKIIQSNGGKFKDKVFLAKGKPMIMRFWFDIEH